MALATFIAVVLVVAALGPSTSWAYRTKYAFDAGRVGSNSYISNQNLSGALERFHHGVVAHSLYYGIDLVLAVAGLALAVWAYRQSSHLLGILVCATVGMVVSPITWVHHMVWAVPILIWLCLADDRPRGGWVWAGAGGLLLWEAPIWSLPYGGSGQELHEHGWQLVVGSSYFFAMVVFLVGGGRHALAAKPKSAPVPFARRLWPSRTGRARGGGRAAGVGRSA